MTQHASELSDFEDLIEATAQWKGLPPGVIEKDYWVVRALQVLRANAEGQFVFKGGTSLSKGWGILDRFSEDLDLLFRRVDLSGAEVTKAELRRRMKQAQLVVANSLGCVPEHVIKTVDKGTPRRDSQIVYQPIFPTVEGILPSIRLEMGPRGTTSNCVDRPISSFVLEFLVDSGQDASVAHDLVGVNITCLEIEVTFVQKLLTAYSTYEKRLNKVRHYYDLYKLVQVPEIKTFAGTERYHKVLREEIESSSEEFPESSVPSMHFANASAFFPDSDGLRYLERSHQGERELYYAGQQPRFGEILTRCQEFLRSKQI